jgi:hypothetical protein
MQIFIVVPVVITPAADNTIDGDLSMEKRALHQPASVT